MNGSRATTWLRRCRWTLTILGGCTLVLIAASYYGSWRHDVIEIVLERGEEKWIRAENGWLGISWLTEVDRPEVGCWRYFEVPRVLAAYRNPSYIWPLKAVTYDGDVLFINLWALAGLFFICPLAFNARWLICRRQRARPGLCRACGYDLTGNISGVCPECGHRIMRG